VTAAEMIEASVRAFDRDETLLCAIFDRITSPITRDEQRSAITAICGARSDVMRLFKEILI
jgi:hypothetical protein